MDPSFDFLVELPFANWSEFRGSVSERIKDAQSACLPKSAVEKYDFETRRYIFRGHACSSWPLWASFDRIFAQHKKLEDPRDVYEDFFRTFLVDSIRNGVNDDRDWIGVKRQDIMDRAKYPMEGLTKFESLARHWGLPTRLLDWTWSVYVAAFFAFWREVDLVEDNVAIWALDIDEAIRCFDESVAFIEEIYPGNQNRTAQEGVYTINKSNVLRLDSLFMRGNARYRVTPKFPILFKCLLPRSGMDQIVRDLRQMRISPIKMFPGKDGLVLYYRQFLGDRLQSLEEQFED
jgi:hypothetical protein